MRAQERATCTSCHKEYPIGWIQDYGRCRMCTEKRLTSSERKQAEIGDPDEGVRSNSTSSGVQSSSQVARARASIRARSGSSPARSAFPTALIVIGVGIVGAPFFGGLADGIIGYFFHLVWVVGAVLLFLYLLLGERVAGPKRPDAATISHDESRRL